LGWWKSTKENKEEKMILGYLEIPENYWESSHDVEYIILESD
jgi:hypothetical protein